MYICKKFNLSSSNLILFIREKKKKNARENKLTKLRFYALRSSVLDTVHVRMLRTIE